MCGRDEDGRYGPAVPVTSVEHADPASSTWSEREWELGLVEAVLATQWRGARPSLRQILAAAAMMWLTKVWWCWFRGYRWFAAGHQRAGGVANRSSEDKGEASCARQAVIATAARAELALTPAARSCWIGGRTNHPTSQRRAWHHLRSTYHSYHPGELYH
jgi:hypothetical protein